MLSGQRIWRIALRGSSVATHDLAMVNELCGRILVIDHGRIIADSDPGILERDERLRVMLGIE